LVEVRRPDQAWLAEREADLLPAADRSLERDSRKWMPVAATVTL
jgi:hypothetical protein